MSKKTGTAALDAAHVSRRDFLTGLALVGGGIAASWMLPWPQAQAHVVAVPGTLSDWSVDDMWGAYPRYAEAIGFAPAADAPALAAARTQADPLDAVFRA